MVVLVVLGNWRLRAGGGRDGTRWWWDEAVYQMLARARIGRTVESDWGRSQWRCAFQHAGYISRLCFEKEAQFATIEAQQIAIVCVISIACCWHLRAALHHTPAFLDGGHFRAKANGDARARYPLGNVEVELEAALPRFGALPIDCGETG